MKSCKRLVFELLPAEAQPINGITKRWVVLNTIGQVLGNIEWRPGWRKYVVQFQDSVFDESCLNEISTFLNNQMHLYKEDLKKRKADAKAVNTKKC